MVRYPESRRVSQIGSFQAGSGGEFLNRHVRVCKTRKRNAIH
jgi:hypothetical protein